MDETGYITFSGLQSIGRGSYTRAHGTSPGMAIIYAYPQAQPPALVGTMTITFGDVQISFRDCLLDALAPQIDGSGQIVECRILDRRWKWRNPVISGEYNRYDDAGELDTFTEKAPQAIASLCLDALGESGYDVSALPNDGRPHVAWDFASAAQALESLCESYGCHVVLGIDDVVRICRVGEGAMLPERPSVMSGGAVMDPAEIPDKVVIYGEPDEFQSDIQLEAVGLDTDGLVKPIDELSYKPSGGWINADVDDGFLTTINDLKARALAQRTVFRWYRPSGTEYSGSINELRWNFALAVSSEGITPNNVKQIEWLDHQVETEQVPGGKSQRAPVVWGVYYDGKDALANNVKFTDARVLNQENPREIDAKSMYRGASKESVSDLFRSGGFAIDYKSKIVAFSEPVYVDLWIGDVIDYHEAYIWLRIAYRLRKKDTLEYVHTTAEKTLGGHAPTLYLKAPDLVRRIAPRYDYNSATAVQQQSDTDYIVNNEQEFIDEARLYLNAIEREFERRDACTYIYEEIISIQLDGAIQQVTWEVGGGTAKTTAQRNNDVQSYLPSYQERRQRQKNAEIAAAFKFLRDNMNKIPVASAPQ